MIISNDFLVSFVWNWFWLRFKDRLSFLGFFSDNELFEIFKFLFWNLSFNPTIYCSILTFCWRSLICILDFSMSSLMKLSSGIIGAFLKTSDGVESTTLKPESNDLRVQSSNVTWSFYLPPGKKFELWLTKELYLSNVEYSGIFSRVWILRQSLLKELLVCLIFC